MKNSVKANLKIALSASVAVVMFYGFPAILIWAGLDWKMWFAFAMGTAMVFGILIAKFSKDLKKPRCFLVFVLLVVVYAGAWFLVLKSGIRLPDSAYIFGSPFEGALAAFILSALGGARGNSLGRTRRVRLSPKTYKSSRAEKGSGAFYSWRKAKKRLLTPFPPDPFSANEYYRDSDWKRAMPLMEE